MQGLLHRAQANLGCFLAWFQALQLPPTEFYIFRSGFKCNRISEGLLYLHKVCLTTLSVAQIV
jgi:hypothetical protein